IDPRHHIFSFLSICFNGHELWVHPEKIQIVRERIGQIADVNHYYDLITVLTKTRNLLEGWLTAFKFVDVDRDIAAIDSYVDEKLMHVFRKFGFVMKEKFRRQIKTSKGLADGLTLQQRKN